MNEMERKEFSELYDRVTGLEKIVSYLLQANSELAGKLCDIIQNLNIGKKR